MQLSTLDWIIMAAFFILSLGIGVAVSRRAGRDFNAFFLGDRSMPWWLLGISMVATTFSTDTPNLVADIVRSDGVFGNWTWWAFLLTGMLTVFLYARLWRRSGALTDVEFYEIRYSGSLAAFLRGFRAVYLGILFNVIIYEQAVRFLTDFLDGDQYYRTTHPGQNLDRCRTQLALLEAVTRAEPRLSLSKLL